MSVKIIHYPSLLSTPLRQISPKSCNVSPLWGEKRQNRPLSNRNTGTMCCVQYAAGKKSRIQISNLLRTNIFMTSGSERGTHKHKINFANSSLFLIHINERTKCYITDYALYILV